MASKKTALNQVPAYRKFITDRDRALERILFRSRQRMSDALGGALTSIERAALHLSHKRNEGDRARSLSIQFETEVDHQFNSIGLYLLGVFIDLRKKSYALAHAGEAEALGRSLGKPARFDSRDQGDRVVRQAPSGGSPLARIELALQRLKRKIVDAFELSRVLKENPAQTLARVQKAFPKMEYHRKPRALLSRVKEAGLGSGGQSFSFGFINDEEWQGIVSDYTKDFIPKYRAPKYDRLGKEAGEMEGLYAWEAEQELTQDFVQNVRDGQVDAASMNGITDFVWIAVIDDKTDECCAWRDGLTTAEIETSLSDKHSDDDCQATVPPAHFNCRCTMAPTTDQIERVEGTNFADFDQWLNDQ